MINISETFSVESEKKAQMQRKVEESKAIRQALAEISYQQWKEKAKGKVISLPKNGYRKLRNYLQIIHIQL